VEAGRGNSRSLRPKSNRGGNGAVSESDWAGEIAGAQR
jgi:hypothetical protein